MAESAAMFDRRYRIRFGQPGARGKEITALRVAFAIERSSDSGANSGTIQIWNLSKESYSELEKPGAIISLEAGYGTEIGMIFQGNNIHLNVRRDLPDVIVEIRAQDGGEQLQKQIVNIGFEPGTLISDAVKQITEAFQKVTGSSIDLSRLNKLGNFSQGFIASGPAKKILDDILKPRGFQWGIQDGEVRIVENSATSTTQETAFVVGPDSGLVGSPLRIKTENKNGIQFTSLLNPRLRPYRSVKLESATISGQYKIENVAHRGDSEQSDWYSLVECVI